MWFKGHSLSSLFTVGRVVVSMLIVIIIIVTAASEVLRVATIIIGCNIIGLVLKLYVG